jgi:penicillin-binding protein 1A
MKKLRKKIFKYILFFIFSFFLVALFLSFVFLAVLSTLPDVRDEANLKPKLSSVILDKDGNTLYTIFGAENREKIAIDEVSSYLINATVIVEDENFWNHHGLDIKGLYRAMRSNVFGVGKKTGGSTITQQYAKNAFLNPEKTYTRKLKEAVLAMSLEYSYSKSQLLELYLNIIPYGNNSFGIKKASELYFGVNPKHLSLAQSAVLSTLPQAPSRYNPYTENRYSRLLLDNYDNSFVERVNNQNDLLEGEFAIGLLGSFVNVGEKEIWISGKADFVVDKMYEKGLITLAERNIAYEDFKTLEFNRYREKIKHPHFVFYVLQELERAYGREFLETGGLKIYTSLDPKLQNYVEDLATKRRNGIKRWAGADNMAVLSVEAKTGNILAMLGSFDFFDESIDGNVNVVLRPRQPGSSVKPFIYAKMFLNGFAPSSRIEDSPMKIGDRRPQNFDGGFTGNISVREALGKSRNIPAVRAYYLAGEQMEIIPFLKNLGLKSLKEKHDYGYPLAIGAGEVSLFEMVQGYSVFANNGEKVDIAGILSIEDFSGNIIYEKNKKSKVVLDSSIAYLINSILSDRSVAIGPNLFVGSHIVAGKSGTSTKSSKGRGAVRPADLWTIGYNPSFVTGVWIGNTDGRGLNFSAEAYTYASPVFSLVMKELLAGRMIEPFPVPEGVKSMWVSRKSGLLPAVNTPREDYLLEYFAEEYFVQKFREIYVPKLIIAEN